jgi:hypothetical protein
MYVHKEAQVQAAMVQSSVDIYMASKQVGKYRSVSPTKTTFHGLKSKNTRDRPTTSQDRAFLVVQGNVGVIIAAGLDGKSRREEATGIGRSIVVDATSAEIGKTD